MLCCEFACDTNVTNAACTASDASNFLRSCVQNVMKNKGLWAKIHRKRGGSLDIHACKSCSRFPVGSANADAASPYGRRPQGDGYNDGYNITCALKL